MHILIYTLIHVFNHLRLIVVNRISCEAGNWNEHIDLKKQSIIGDHICSPFMWICSQLLQRGQTGAALKINFVCMSAFHIV